MSPRSARPDRRPINVAVHSMAQVAAEILVEATESFDRNEAVDLAAGAGFLTGFQAAASFCATYPDQAAALYRGSERGVDADPIADQAVTENIARLLDAVTREASTPRRLS